MKKLSFSFLSTILVLSVALQIAAQERGNMNAFQLSSTQTFRQGFTVEPIGLHPLSWSSGIDGAAIKHVYP
jgi:hypothetical protein